MYYMYQNPGVWNYGFVQHNIYIYIYIYVCIYIYREREIDIDIDVYIYVYIIMIYIYILYINYDIKQYPGRVQVSIASIGR